MYIMYNVFICLIVMNYHFVKCDNLDKSQRNSQNCRGAMWVQIKLLLVLYLAYVPTIQAGDDMIMCDIACFKVDLVAIDLCS